ncbi:MAG: MazG family protein, partial [Synechococcus sp.]
MANAPSDAIQRLIDVVAQLRDPTTGCPWDLEQTHASLVPYVLEEAHEVADAIRQGSDAEMKEELGDLLLQVVLHAQIAREQQRFDLDAIADGISDKLIRRHPHVFGDAVASTSDEVRRSWEAIKLQEQAEALADSEAWAETSKAIRNLQGEWKDTGAAPKAKEQALWARFR